MQSYRGRLTASKHNNSRSVVIVLMVTLAHAKAQTRVSYLKKSVEIYPLFATNSIPERTIAMQTFDQKSNSVRITFRLNTEKLAAALRMKTVLRPFLVNPLREDKNIVNVGHAQLGWKYGNVVLYTDTANLNQTLDFVQGLVQKHSIPDTLSPEKGSKPSIVVEFSNPDSKRVVSWFEKNPNRLDWLKREPTEFQYAYRPVFKVEEESLT